MIKAGFKRETNGGFSIEKIRVIQKEDLKQKLIDRKEEQDELTKRLKELDFEKSIFVKEEEILQFATDDRKRVNKDLRNITSKINRRIRIISNTQDKKLSSEVSKELKVLQREEKILSKQKTKLDKKVIKAKKDLVMKSNRIEKDRLKTVKKTSRKRKFQVKKKKV